MRRFLEFRSADIIEITESMQRLIQMIMRNERVATPQPCGGCTNGGRSGKRAGCGSGSVYFHCYERLNTGFWNSHSNFSTEASA